MEQSIYSHWKEKALNIIRESYRKQNYFDEVYAYIENLFMYEFEYYSD